MLFMLFVNKVMCIGVDTYLILKHAHILTHIIYPHIIIHTQVYTHTLTHTHTTHTHFNSLLLPTHITQLAIHVSQQAVHPLSLLLPPALQPTPRTSKPEEGIP